MEASCAWGGERRLPVPGRSGAVGRPRTRRPGTTTGLPYGRQPASATGGGGQPGRAEGEIPSPAAVAVRAGGPPELRDPPPFAQSGCEGPKSSRRALVKRRYSDYPDWRSMSARHPFARAKGPNRGRDTKPRSGTARGNGEARPIRGENEMLKSPRPARLPARAANRPSLPFALRAPISSVFQICCCLVAAPSGDSPRSTPNSERVVAKSFAGPHVTRILAFSKRSQQWQRVP